MFQHFIIEALTNSCGHFRTMPLRIRRLIGFMHGILHTRCFLFYALLSLRHHVIHFIVYESLNKMNKISNEMICWWMEKIVIDFTFWWKMFEREQQRQTRRIRVIRLHDIYLDSENEILIILSNISEAVDHPDQESSTEFWNLMPRKKFSSSNVTQQGPDVIFHWSCNYAFLKPCPNSMRGTLKCSISSSHQIVPFKRLTVNRTMRNFFCASLFSLLSENCREKLPKKNFTAINSINKGKNEKMFWWIW